jgi:hypothetical protein
MLSRTRTANGLSRAAVELQNGFRSRKVGTVMVLSIRSNSYAFVDLPLFRRAPRAAAGGLRAAVLRATAGFAALVALLVFAIPAQADEIEPEPESTSGAEPEAKAEPEGKPEPESEPEPVPAAVAEEKGPSEPAWIPSIEIGFEAYSYDGDTTIINLSDPTTFSEIQAEAADQILFRIGAELMGPMFEDLPGRPRLFVQGGVGFPTYTNSNIFDLGNPDDPEEPETGIARYQTNGPGQRDLPADFDGQGSRLDADLQDPSWYAGLGIAFNVLTSDALLFYVKPSFQYSMERIDFEGKLKTVFDENPGVVDPDPCGTSRNPPVPCLHEYTIRESNVEFDTTDHLIGPGLEVAMGFLASRPIRISVFAQVRALWVVSGTTNSAADPAGVASYNVDRNDLVFKGGAGVRLSWVGFD